MKRKKRDIDPFSSLSRVQAISLVVIFIQAYHLCGVSPSQHQQDENRDRYSLLLPYLVTIVEDRHLVALAHQLLGQVEAQEGVAASFRVGDEDRVGAADERAAAGRGRSGGAGGKGAHSFRKNGDNGRREKKMEKKS